MDFEIPSAWVEFGDALLKFIDREVAALEHEHKHRALLASARRLLDGDTAFWRPPRARGQRIQSRRPA